MALIFLTILAQFGFVLLYAIMRGFRSGITLVLFMKNGTPYSVFFNDFHFWKILGCLGKFNFAIPLQHNFGIDSTL